VILAQLVQQVRFSILFGGKVYKAVKSA